MNEKTRAALEELRNKYIKSFPEKISQIRKYIATKDLPPIQVEFHKLKGSGKTYGISDISDIAVLIEQHCKNNHPQTFENAEKACLLLEKIKNALENNLTFNALSDPLFKEIQ